REARDVLGDRRVAVARELTKLHEEVVRGRISEVEPRLGDVRGEVVIVLEGAPDTGAPAMEPLVEEARRLVAGGARKREAASRVARRHGVSANELYRALVGGE